MTVLAAEPLEQVSMDAIKHFDNDATELVLRYHLAGWRSHMTSRGHVFLKAPDGAETATVSRESLRGRSGRNAAAPLKRWLRRQEQEREQAAKGAGSSFGIPQPSPEDDPHLPPRLVNVLRDHADVMSYIGVNADRFTSAAVMRESMYIGYDLDDRPWEKWVLVDTEAKVLVAHGQGYTRNEALRMLRDEGKLPPATMEELMAEADGTTCPECGQQTASRGGLELHLKSKHIGFTCPECGAKTGFSPRSYAKHRTDEHGVLPAEQVKRDARARRKNPCPHCGEGFTSPQGLANHVRRAHNVDKRAKMLLVFKAAASDGVHTLEPYQVAPRMGMTESATKSMLARMAHDGLLVRTHRGVYALPGDVTVTTLAERAGDVVPAGDTAGEEDVTVTSPEPAPSEPPTPVVLDEVPDEDTAAGMIAKIQAVVSPAMIVELAELRQANANLVYENELLTKERDDLRTLFTMVQEAATKGSA